MKHKYIQLQSWCSDVEVVGNLVELKLKRCGKYIQLPTLGHLPCLQSLEITGLHEVKRIGDEFYFNNRSDNREACSIFPALKKLVLSEMRGLEEWVAPEQRAVVFPCLQVLEISRCDQLRTLAVTRRPISIYDVPLTTLEIRRCKKLSNLGLELGLIEKLTVESCEELMSVSVGKLTSPKILRLQDCRDLATLILNESSSLESLDIFQCPSLKSLGDEDEEISSVHNLTVLETLNIQACKSLPMKIQNCQSLKSVLITDCKSLVLGDLPSLVDLYVHDLKELNIGTVTSLKELSMGEFSDEVEEYPVQDLIQSNVHLERLYLRGWDKLKSLPHQIQHLTALKELYIYGFNGMEEALPEWFGNLSSLEALEISQCKQLKYLPSVEAMKRLTNLQQLIIDRCPDLQRNCTKDTGSEWPKISHIQRVYLY